MKKNNKGIALAYTLMMMLVVFAICAVITSLMVAHVTASNRYSGSAETERVCTQIGELFHAAMGDYQDGEESPFAKALEAAEFEVEIPSEFEVEIPSEEDEETENEGTVSEEDGSDSLSAVWSVTSGDYVFMLHLSTEGGVSKLSVLNNTETKIFLTVGIQDGKIVEWTKGVTSEEPEEAEETA